MNKIRSFIKYGVLPLCFFLVFSGFYVGIKFLVSPVFLVSDYAGPSENLFNLKIPKDLHFAGELIPKDDYSIKENMEKVFAGGNFERSTAYILFNRATQWFPLIERILEKNKIPEDFKYIALAESRLTNGTSPQGAVGFWQFIESTAKNYGLEVSAEVDERYDVIKSTEAACQFFKEAHKKFGNWTLCAAAYNMGMGGVENHLKKQTSKSYYDLMMNKETSFYIYRILALKTVFMNSDKKFHKGGRNIYNIPSLLLKVDSGISNLNSFAITEKYSLEILKTYNPWLIANSLSNPEKRIYIIRFPKKEYLKKITGDLITKIDSFAIKQKMQNDTLILKNDSSDHILNDSLKNE